MLWFLGTVIISSGLVPLPDLMAEHRAYLPSVGIFVMIACVVDRVRLWRPSRVHAGLVGAVVVAALAGLSWATCARNQLWGSAIALWQDTAVKSPRCYVAWVNLGAAHVRYGERQEAVKAFHEAIEIRPRVLMGYYNLADSLAGLKRWSECLEVVDAAIGGQDVRHPMEVQMLYYRGLSLAGSGRLNEGLRVLEQVVENSPDHFYANKLLGACHLGLQEKEKARFLSPAGGAVEGARSGSGIPAGPDRAVRPGMTSLGDNAVAGSLMRKWVKGGREAKACHALRHVAFHGVCLLMEGAVFGILRPSWQKIPLLQNRPARRRRHQPATCRPSVDMDGRRGPAPGWQRPSRCSRWRSTDGPWTSR
jgi:hypothetical protein